MKKSILFVAVAGALFTMSAQANTDPNQKEETVVEGKIFGSQSEELMRLREDFILQEKDIETQSFEMLNMISPSEIGLKHTALSWSATPP